MRAGSPSWGGSEMRSVHRSVRRPVRRSVRRPVAPVAALALGLAACSIPDTAFRATATAADAGVTDVDHQTIVLGTASLSVAEGSSKTFDVSLAVDPGGPGTVYLANDNQAALPIRIDPDPAPQNGMLAIAFTSANYSTPVHVKVSPPIDSNN